MSKIASFNAWLNLSFSDLYSVYSEKDCELHIVDYSIDANVQQFMRFLKSEYPDFDFDTADISKSERVFCFTNGDYTIEIETFDDKVYHIDLIQSGG